MINNVPDTVTVDAGTGWIPIVTDGDPAGTDGIHVLGTDGTNAQIIKTNTSGQLEVVVVSGGGGGAVTVEGQVAHDGDASGVDPILIGGYASAAAPANVSADGDAVRAWFDRAGRLAIWDGGLTISVDDGTGSLTVDGAVTVSGAVAHDAAYAGNPILIGGYASAAAPSAVSADGDVVQAWYDRSGRQAIWDGNASITIDDGASSITVDGTVGLPTSASMAAEVISVGNTATEILAANSARKGFVIVNNSGVPIYVGGDNSITKGTTAGANKGALLTTNGSSFGSGQAEGYVGAVYGITDTGSALVAALEW